MLEEILFAVAVIWVCAQVGVFGRDRVRVYDTNYTVQNRILWRSVTFNIGSGSRVTERFICPVDIKFKKDTQ